MEKVEWSNFPLPLIQVNPPSVSDTDLFLQTAYQRGIFSNSGQLQRLASNRIAENFGSDFSGYLACSNTMALVACLLRVGVRGRHVVISNFTFAATAHAVILSGGIPVLCDINPGTLELDVEALREILNSDQLSVAVVLPTRVFGYANDFSNIIKISKEYGVDVIIDSAASLPSRKNMWNFEEFALFEVFSLHATKVFGIGEGGFVIGNYDNIEQVRSRANFGFPPSSNTDFRDGLNAKADEFTAARALSRLKSYNTDVEKRFEFVEMYKSVFSEFSFTRFLEDNQRTIFSYFPIIFESEEKLNVFISKISPYLTTRRYYFPTIRQGYSGDVELVTEYRLEVSESISSRILCLPVYVFYADEVKWNIATTIREILEQMK